jgi:deoxyribodipyrimidine photo-lyase
MRPLVWFRSDLRTLDNAALSHAARAADAGAFALFVISPGEWREHDYAPAKVDLILRTLRELSASLAKYNIPLLIRTAPLAKDVPIVVTTVMREHACDALFFNKEYEVNEARRDARVAALCKQQGWSVTACTDQSILEPGDVLTGEGRPFTVFTPFKKAAYRVIESRGGVREWPLPKKQHAMLAQPDLVPGAVAGFASRVDPAHWPAGERDALAQMRHFIEKTITRYKDERDFPGQRGTSMLSPYLAIGAISPRQCVVAAVQANAAFMREKDSPLDSGNPGISHWISEVLWREFYIHITHSFPRVCKGRAFQPATERIEWNDNPQHFEAWKQGKTGVPIVDAGMRQLLEIGWMHNRVRMVVAMYLTKNLFLDWRLGEKWFMQNLVDGFLASNNGGWQWSASTGTDAAPYFRVFNPISQSQKFDPQGEYIRTYVPELRDIEGDAIHEPWTLPGLLRSRIDYPEPLVNLSASRSRAIEAFRELKSGV